MKPDYNQAWKLVSTAIRLAEVTAPSAAQISTNTLALYAKDRTGVSSLYFKDDAGVEHDLGALTSAAALTRTNDTNVTVTLGGTPATALLQAVSLTLGWTGTLAETRGGTAQSTYTLGDILYSSAANTLAKLAGNTSATLKILTQTGTGAVSAAPAWTDLASLTGANVTAASSKISLGGTPTGAALKAFSIDVAEANLTHNSIGGLTAGDPHTQYAYLAGRGGGQTLIGGTAAADDLTFQTTSGVGAGSDTIIFKFGNNGATTAFQLFHTSSYGVAKINGTSGAEWDLSVGGTTKWLGYTDGTIFSIYDSVGALDALTIDGSQNVAIPNGNLTVSGVFGGTGAGSDLALVATHNASPSGANIWMYAGETDTRQIAAFTRDATIGYLQFYTQGSSGQFNLEFYDATTRKWTWYKTTAHAFNLYSDVTSTNRAGGHATLDAFLHTIPAARVYRNSQQTIANTTNTTIVFNTSVYDTAGIWNSAAAMVAPVAGYYLCEAQIEMGGIGLGANGYLIIQLTHSSGTAISQNRVLQSTGANDIVNVTGVYSFAASEYFVVDTQHNYGGNNNTGGNGQLTHATMTYLGGAV